MKHFLRALFKRHSKLVCGYTFRISAFLLPLMLACVGSGAQAPTSLQYPTPNYIIANVNSIYMAPTVSGTVTSYSITPALPAGLSFNTTTGVISGTPTAASATTIYTITATNGSGSTTAQVSITANNSFFNNAYSRVSFLDAKRTFKVGTGQAAGDIALYDSVTVIGGQAIDCIVKTVAVNNVSSWQAYDQSAASGTGYSSNSDSFFSPQFNFNTGGGYATFTFQFILGGSYNNATNTGTVVTLQNVKLNTYDIDGNGNASSNQYNEFDGFSSSELGSSSTINAPAYSTATSLSQYLSSISTNSSVITADATRVRLTYDNMSSFTINVGAGANGLAYFFLDFSSGPTFSTAVAATPPTLDLNTSTTGTGNGITGCATALSFSAASQTNAASGTALNELIVSYDNTSAHLPDGANEQLLINGATAGTGTHALNFTSNGTSNVTVGGVAYTITKTVSGSTNIISFANGSTFTLANAEDLLDALRYSNAQASPTNGSRSFTVNIRNTAFMSPDAVFTASLNCVSISGHIYHDVNGLTDNAVNASAAGTTGTATGQFAAGAGSGVYAVLTNASTNAVLSTVAISAGGAFSFGRQDPGDYNIFVSNTATPGATVTAAAYPTLSAATLQPVGENLGSSAGTDGNTDGKIRVTLGSTPVTNANFGLQLPPTTTSYAFGNQPNPGGFNHYTIPTIGFTGTDIDGSVQSLVITAFPTNANYLKVGSTIYTNGGTCPPQSTCTAWPGTLTVPYSTVGSISVDPTATGTTTVSLPYRVIDDGNFTSNGGVASTITVPFIAPSTPITVSGNVWNDADGDGIKDIGEAYTNAASSGQTLYAMLVQKTNTYSGANTVLSSTPVTAAATGYSFSNVPSGNDYEVRIASLAAAPADGAAWSSITPALATTYVGVSTNNNGTITAGQNTADLVNALGTVTTDKLNVNFGIERRPTADAKAFTAPNIAFTKDATITIGGKATYSILANSGLLSGTLILSLSGTDAEDCALPSTCALGKKFTINSINANTLLYYFNGASWQPLLANQTISSLTLASLRIHGQQGQGYTAPTALGFTYSLVDNAGIPSAPASYSIQSSTAPLPITLISFDGYADGCEAILSWKAAHDEHGDIYVVEASEDGQSFAPLRTIAARAGADGYSYNIRVPMNAHAAFYRLKLTAPGGSADYSNTLRLTGACSGPTDVQLYPNPATQTIHLTGIGTGAVVKVFDLTGRVVWVAQGVSEHQPLDIAALPAGGYIVEVNTRAAAVRHAHLQKAR